MTWFDKQVACGGSAYFPGTLPPRPAEFKYIVKAGVRILEKIESDDSHWGIRVEHPEWGGAKIVALRDFRPLPEELLNFSRGLSQQERNAAQTAGTGVSVLMKGAAKHVLRDRKNLLRYLRLLLGDDGLYASDHTSQITWSRAMLDDELAHDADVDVSALYTVHCVGENAKSIDWMHTHGLAEVGGYDFDILNPSADILTLRGEDPIRAVAYALLEGAIGPGANKTSVMGFPMRLVDVADFHRKALPEHAALRDATAPGHNEKRVVLCDPPKGIFGLGDRIIPSQVLSAEIPDGMLVQFSTEASNLMAQRARDTYGVFRSIATELKPLELPTIVKIGYEIDGARKPGDREHLWFSVNELHANEIDATLESSPYAIARMKLGDRGRHDVCLLSDWVIVTPAGPITPRSTSAYRQLKEAIARGSA